MSASEYRRLMSSGKSGAAWRGSVAKPTECRGIRFPSKIQAAVYSLLTNPLSMGERPAYAASMSEKQVVIREPIIDLLTLAVNGKPGRWRPDFLVIRFQNIRRYLLDGPVDRTVVEIHEAKGSRASESRDWRLRAAAAHNEYPNLPIYVWRWSGKQPVRFTLEEAFK